MVKKHSGTRVQRLLPASVWFLFLMLLLAGCRSQKEVVQPIAYNHKIHYTEAGLDCTDCHTGVEKEVHAILPSIEVCEACHSEPLGESAEEAKVVEAVNSGTEIPWKRVYTVPEHVFFSHRRHVTAGQIPCTTCHGAVDQLTAPTPVQLIPVTMKRCMSCHDNKSISNDCIHCHV